MPSGLTRFLLRRRWILRPGLETDAPLEAAERYRKALKAAGYQLEGKRVLILGYGGRYAVACALLEMAARQVVLCEADLSPDTRYNRTLLPRYSTWLEEKEGNIIPRQNALQVIRGDIRELVKGHCIETMDIVLTSSVYEHLEDVEGITQALASITAPEGIHLHYIDLRDHYFQYPFEMLKYSPGIWHRLLNPTSNLNRYRLWQYRQIFEQYFKSVTVEVLESNPIAFQRAQKQIRPEFLSGDMQVDSATLIKVIAQQPTL